MVEQVNRSLAGQSLIARLSTFFGLLAAFLGLHRHLRTHVLRRDAADE